MKDTQSKQILEYMKKHGSITPLEALQHIGCLRLSGRIFDLRQEGYRIRTDMERVQTRDNGYAFVAVYRLESENGEG